MDIDYSFDYFRIRNATEDELTIQIDGNGLRCHVLR